MLWSFSLPYYYLMLPLTAACPAIQPHSTRAVRAAATLVRREGQSHSQAPAHTVGHLAPPWHPDYILPDSATLLFCSPDTGMVAEAVLRTGGAGQLLTGRCVTCSTHQLQLGSGWDRHGHTGTSRLARAVLLAELSISHWSGGTEQHTGRARAGAGRIPPNTCSVWNQHLNLRY